MKFKKLICEATLIENTVGEVEKMKQDLYNNSLTCSGPMSDLCDPNRKPAKHRAPGYAIRDLVTALALCHNVTPMWVEGRKEP
jgi:hypothetical protein